MKRLQNIYKKQLSIVPLPVLAYAVYTLPVRSHCTSHTLPEEVEHSEKARDKEKRHQHEWVQNVFQEDGYIA